MLFGPNNLGVFSNNRAKCIHHYVSTCAGLHVLLEVSVYKLKDEEELALCLNAVFELHNVRVLQLPQQRDLSQCCRGDAFILYLQPYALQQQWQRSDRCMFSRVARYADRAEQQLSGCDDTSECASRNKHILR